MRGLREVLSTQALVSAQLVDQVLQECPVNQKCLHQQAALLAEEAKVGPLASHNSQQGRLDVLSCPLMSCVDYQKPGGCPRSEGNFGGCFTPFYIKSARNPGGGPLPAFEGPRAQYPGDPRGDCQTLATTNSSFQSLT